MRREKTSQLPISLTATSRSILPEGKNERVKRTKTRPFSVTAKKSEKTGSVHPSVHTQTACGRMQPRIFRRASMDRRKCSVRAWRGCMHFEQEVRARSGTPLPHPRPHSRKLAVIAHRAHIVEALTIKQYEEAAASKRTLLTFPLPCRVSMLHKA